MYNVNALDVVIPMYNLKGHNDNYSKTSDSSWQHSRDDPNVNITGFKSFKFQIIITGKAPAAGNTKNVKKAVPLKYFK